LAAKKFRVRRHDEKDQSAQEEGARAPSMPAVSVADELIMAGAYDLLVRRWIRNIFRGTH